MRFAATHKAVSYLMVGTAFLLLALTGELPLLLTLITAVGVVGSYFFDPQTQPWMQRRAYAYVWYALLLVVLVVLVPDVGRGESWWDSGTRYLCVFLLAKLWQRRNNSDYLQAYVVSFLMLLSASLLGTSVLYSLGLLLYIVFSTWTLTLFHLRREMEENYLLKHLPGRHGQAAESERVEVERILNSRRVVGTSFLMASGLVSVGIFALAGLFFLLLPRVGVSLDLPLRRRGLLLTGFAEQISLGGHGLLRDNPKVVMRVETPGTAPPLGLRFRGIAFDHYERGQWVRSRAQVERPLAHTQGLHVLDGDGGAAGRQAALHTEIYLEPLEAQVLFVPGPGRLLAVQLPDSWVGAGQWPLQLGPEDELLAKGRRGGVHYAVYTARGAQDPSAAAVPAAPPLTPAELAPYLQLPGDLPRRIRDEARRIVGGAATPRDKARAIESYLQKSFAYTTQLFAPTHSEPLEDFLFDKRRGHCEYFATAMAVMLRAVDIPSRSVNGYLGGEWNEYGRYLVVRQQHAHSWVEGYIQGQGWVTYDPTPLLAGPLRSRGLFYKVGQFSDSLEMSWSKYVIEYDLRAQLRLAERLQRVFSFGGGKLQLGSSAQRRELRLILGSLAYAGAGLLSVTLLVGLLRRQKRRRQPAVQLQLETQGQLRRALLVLRRRGHHQRPGETLQQLAARVELAGDSAGASFAELVQRYYAHRFGQQEIDLAEVARLTRAMARAPRSSSALPALAPGGVGVAASDRDSAPVPVAISDEPTGPT